MSTPTRITHLVAGTPWEGSAERTSPVFNPATGEQTGVLDLAVGGRRRRGRGDREGGVAGLGRGVPGEARPRSSSPSAQLLDERKQELAAFITAEHGKVLDDALGEVTRGLEVAEFACGIPHLLKGGFSENASTSVDVVLDAPAARRRRRSSRPSTSRPWCRCGSSRSPSPAGTRSCSSPARRTPRAALAVAGCGRRPVSPTAS